jgi:hypothetical protein
MIMDQTAAPVTRINEFAMTASRCMGCPGCVGPCLALIELMTLPNAILRRSKSK